MNQGGFDQFDESDNLPTIEKTNTTRTSLSDEQRLFVEFPHLRDSKLFAPPGSGKSTCVIERQIFLVQSGMIFKHQSLILSFSRNSRQDIENRVFTRCGNDVSQYFLQSKGNSTVENIKTLDALSFQIQSELGHVPNYEDLSYDLSRALNRLFENSPDSHLFQESANIWRRIQVLCDLKVIFVDEAQDLDCYQFNIILKLQQLLGLTITLVGDPNQSIYNFKKSSPEFMVQFPASEFYLTRNFRSSSAIVDFAEHLKPHPTPGGKETKSFASHSVNTKPHVFHTFFNEFWKWLEHFLRTYDGDLSQIAILCPTKGHSSGSTRGSLKFTTKQSKLHGLARVTNLLDQCGIPFIQGYNESSDSDNQTRFETKSGHVNVLTFHGSKGKEWDTVICCDVWHELLNSQPSQSELNDQKYLLFVAMTRARHRLFVHIEQMENDENSITRRRLPNQFMTLIPQHLYTGKFAQLPKTFPLREMRHQISSVTEIAKKMPHDLRSELREIVKWEIMDKTQVYQDYREICESVVLYDNILFGEFLENLFSMQCAHFRHAEPRKINVVHAFLTGKKVVLSSAEFSLIYPVWNSNGDWQVFDRHQKSLSSLQRDTIAKHFTRSVDWKSHFLTCDDSNELLWNQYSHVRECYNIYLDTTLHWKDKIESLFFLTVVQYTYANNHLFHTRNGARVKKHLISEKLHPLFDSMSQFAAKFSSETSFSEQVPIRLPFLPIDGVMDIQFNNSAQKTGDNRIMETKACKDICAFPHICQVFLYLLADMADFHDLNTRPVILFNFLSGELVTVKFTIHESAMMRLFTLLAVSSATSFDSLTLRIQTSSPEWTRVNGANQNSGDGVNQSGGDGANQSGGDGVNQSGGDGANQSGGDGVNQSGGDGANQSGGDGVNQSGGDGVNQSGDGVNQGGGDGANQSGVFCDETLSITVRNEEYSFNWFQIIDTPIRHIDVTKFQEFLNCMNGKCRIICEGRLTEQKTLLERMGVSFRRVNYQQTSEIPWVDAAWLEDTFWPELPKQSSQPKQNKRQCISLGANYFKIP